MRVVPLRSRRPGPTELTWEEKNPADYRYHPKDTSKLRDFIERAKSGTSKVSESES